MAAPKVRKLNNLIKQIGASVKPQKALIDADIASNATAGAAQEAGLAATQENAFGAIEQKAQNKGMFFSGAAPDEQYQYTASTYLPALANLQATIAATRSQLLGKKADLDTSVFQQAFGAREGDIGRQFQWKSTQDQQKFTAQQAAIERQFQAGENAKARAAQAAAAAARAPKGPSTGQVVTSIVGELQKAAGKDGYVNPKTYHDGRQAWVALGGKPADYDNTFRGFANPSHIGDYLASGL